MASRQKHSAFLVHGDHLMQCLSDSGKWQAAVVSEPSSFLAFVPAKHLCPRLSAPPRAQPSLQRLRGSLRHTAGLETPPWPNPGLSPFCWSPHHAMSVPIPILQSWKRGATIAVPASRCTRLTQGEGSKPPSGALRMFDAEQAWSDCDSSVPSQVISVWARES